MTNRKGTEGQATQWPKEKGQKDKQQNGRFLSFCPFSFGHCVACPSVLFFWSLCGLSFCPFLLVIVLLVLLAFSFRHCVACPSVIFFMAKRKRTEGQATQ
jgi:hypothetical protein